MTPEQMAEWRKHAEEHVHDACDQEPMCDDRVLALLDTVERLTAEYRKWSDIATDEQIARENAEAERDRYKQHYLDALNERDEAEAELRVLRKGVEEFAVYTTNIPARIRALLSDGPSA